MDTFSREKRSEIMSNIRSRKNKSTEMKLIEIFKMHKITGWRRNYKIFGNPDFVFPNFKVAIFTDGCFWHGHKCRNTVPKTNARYWADKIKRNKKRAFKVNRHLADKGWKVIRLWECEINDSRKRATLIQKIRSNIV